MSSTNNIRRYYRVIDPENPTFTRAQNGLGDAVDDLSALCTSFLPLNGRLIKGISLTGTTTLLVVHKLGRKYRGAFPVNVSATSAASVVIDSASTADPATTIAIKASGTCVVDLWVW